MPLVKISILKGWDKVEKKKASDIIHNSLVKAFKIPESDYSHRIIEFEKENFIFPESKSEKIIIIEMDVFPGRSKNAKKELYKMIVDSLELMGIPRNDVTIVLSEPLLENWGIKGGKAADEENIGFNIKV